MNASLSITSRLARILQAVLENDVHFVSDIKPEDQDELNTFLDELGGFLVSAADAVDANTSSSAMIYIDVVKGEEVEEEEEEEEEGGEAEDVEEVKTGSEDPQPE